MCRTYLRHQIRQYLHRHADMPPKAIVLVALLIPEQASRDETSTADDDSARQAKPQLVNHSYCMALCCFDCRLHASLVRMSQTMLAPCAQFLMRCLTPGSIFCDFIFDSCLCSGPNAEPSTSGQNQEEQNARLVGTVELSFAASTRARYLTLNAPVVSYMHSFALDSMFTDGRMDNRMTSYAVVSGDKNSWTNPYLYIAAQLFTMRIVRPC